MTRKHKLKPKRRRAIPNKAVVAVDNCAHAAFIGLFLLALRAGYSHRDIARLSKATITSLPRAIRSRGAAQPEGFDDLAHVLTMWHSLKPSYLKEGRPRALPAVGPEPSIEALLQRVNPNLDLNHSIDYLVESGTIERRGSLYVPLRRWLRYRNTPHQASQLLRHVAGLMTSADRNMLPLPPSGVTGPIEQVVDCPNFPISGLEALDRFVKEQGAGFLEDLDSYMSRRERQRNPKEVAVRIGVGLYQFQVGRTRQTRVFNAMLSQVKQQMKPPR